MDLYVPSFVVLLPELIYTVVGVIVGLIIAAFIEGKKGHIGRGIILANIFLLWQVLLQKNITDDAFILYLNISIIFFVIVLYSFLSIYIKKIDYQPLSSTFYQLSYGLYSSKTVLGLVIASIYGWGFGSAVIISVIIWFLAIKYLNHNPPFMS